MSHAQYSPAGYEVAKLATPVAISISKRNVYASQHVSGGGTKRIKGTSETKGTRKTRGTEETGGTGESRELRNRENWRKQTNRENMRNQRTCETGGIRRIEETRGNHRNMRN